MKEFDTFNRKHNLIECGDTLVVGVSGGVDSMVLLDMLINRRESMQLSLVAVHINHMLRGELAERDENLVKTYCVENNIEYKVFHEDVSEIAKIRKNGFEEAGRAVRYQRFFEVKDQSDANKVVLAHHLDDATETFFLKLFRGTGLNGLSGIEPKRDDGVVRPLLWMSKEDIYRYAKEQSVPYFEDATNEDISYERNMVRNQLIPFIHENMRNGAIVGVEKTMDRVRREQSFLKSMCNDLVEKFVEDAIGGYYIDESWFDSQHETMKYRIFYQLLLRLISQEKGINEDKIFQSLSLFKTGTEVIFDSNVVVERASNGWYLYNKQELRAKNYIISDNGDGTYRYEYWGHVKDLSIREPNEGDKVFLKGMSKMKRLNRYFIDAKIPKYQRPYISLLVDQNQIVAILGMRQCEPIQETENNERIPVIVTVVSDT